MADFAKVQQFGSGPLKTLAQTMIARDKPAQMYRPSAQPAAVPPEFTPATLASRTVQVRRQWTRDAIPVYVAVQSGHPYMLTIDYYSPSTRKGLIVTPGPNGPAMQRATDPHFGTVALPHNFKSLGEAIAAAKRSGVSGALDHANLNWDTYSTGPSGLFWNMAFGAEDNPAQVDATAVSPQEFQRLLAAAQRGDAKSQYELAMAYALGNGTPVDLAQSVQWLDRAAAQGDPEAENKLGQFYLNGTGVASNPQQAAYLYGKAAEAGYGPAQYNLGLLYERGQGVAKDLATAEKWLMLAYRNGVQAAQDELYVVRSAQQTTANASSPSMEQLATQIAWQYCRSIDDSPFGHPDPGEHPVLFLDYSDVWAREYHLPTVYCVFPVEQNEPVIHDLYVRSTPPRVGTPEQLQQQYGLPTTYRYYTCTKQHVWDNVPQPGDAYYCSR